MQHALTASGITPPGDANTLTNAADVSNYLRKAQSLVAAGAAQ
jgi:hypothetical protein